MRKQPFIGVVALLITTLLISPAAKANDLAAPPQRTLVVIVHGTLFLLPRGHWMELLPGMATFASELKRAMGPGSEIDPFFWSGQDSDTARVQAALSLAKFIDQQAPNFDRICLVGHSHGGNVALMAAGLCHHKIDMVVCLSTPHFYLETIGPDQTKLLLPLYCTWDARQNISRIVNICVRFDDVVNIWARLFKGSTMATAREFTRSWQDHLDAGHLADDLSNWQMGEVVPGIPMFLQLNVADINQPVESFADVLKLGETPGEPRHSATHSRRTGYVIGELLRDGPTKERMSYIATLIEPKDTDTGEPIGDNAEQGWNLTHQQDFTQIGWRLDRIVARVDDSARRIVGDLPRVQLTADRTGFAWRASPLTAAPDKLNWSWTTNLVLDDGQTGSVSLDGVGGTLVAYRVSAEGQPPTSLIGDPTSKEYWSADLSWTPVHY